MIEDSGSFQFREILFASWIAGLRVLRLSAGFKKENSPKNQVPLCYHVTGSGKGIPFLWFDMSFMPLLALFPGRAKTPFNYPFFVSCCYVLQLLLFLLTTGHSIRVSYLLANLHQWFSRYTCSPERNSRSQRHNLGTPRLQTGPYALK